MHSFSLSFSQKKRYDLKSLTDYCSNYSIKYCRSKETNDSGPSDQDSSPNCLLLLSQPLALGSGLVPPRCLTPREWKEGPNTLGLLLFLLSSGRALPRQERQAATQSLPSDNWGRERPTNKAPLTAVSHSLHGRRKGSVCWGCSPASSPAEQLLIPCPWAPLAPSPGWGSRKWEHQLQGKRERSALSFTHASCFSFSFCFHNITVYILRNPPYPQAQRSAPLPLPTPRMLPSQIPFFLKGRPRRPLQSPNPHPRLLFSLLGSASHLLGEIYNLCKYL